MILVCGATGTVGSEVVKRLAAKGAAVRVLTRDPEHAKKFEGLGVEIATGDLTKPETLDATLEGIDRVFLLTARGNIVEMEGNLIEAAKRAGVKHIVKLSVLGVEPDSPVLILKWHSEIEKILEASGLNYTILRPHFFMQNMVREASSILSTHGIYYPMRDGKISMVDVRDIADVAVAALTEDGHEGKIYEITGPEALSFEEVAKKLSNAIGEELQYVDIPPETAKKGMVDAGVPEELADDFLKFFDIWAAGKLAYVTTTVEEVTKHKPLDFDTFATDYSGEFKQV